MMVHLITEMQNGITQPVRVYEVPCAGVRFDYISGRIKAHILRRIRGVSMTVKDLSHNLPLYYRGKTPDGSEYTIPSEHLMEVWVNDRLTMKVTCTGQYLPELVLGRLLTEDIIVSEDDVEEIRICESGLTARVYLSPGRAEKRLPDTGPGEEQTVSVTPTCCTGNRILDHYYSAGRPFRKLPPAVWKPEWIRTLAEDAEWEDRFPLYAATHAVHACSLMEEGVIRFRCEDIGRHNALDKAIGYALRKGMELSRTILFTSGRVPTDMAVKAVRAGVPVLAARKLPTAEALILAEEYGLTILRTGKNGVLFCGTGSFFKEGELRK